MGHTNKERVLEYIWAASPMGASNSEIQRGTGITSHQQVYLLTQELAGTGWIQSGRRGREWVFWADESVRAQLASPGRVGTGELRRVSLTFEAFAEQACQALSAHLGVPLAPGLVPGVPRAFELVSPDRSVVGCTLYYAPVQGQRLPAARFSLIAERAWLLEKAGAQVALMAFGYDRDVPLWWLRRYGHLAPGVRFYFLGDDGTLEELKR